MEKKVWPVVSPRALLSIWILVSSKEGKTTGVDFFFFFFLYVRHAIEPFTWIGRASEPGYVRGIFASWAEILHANSDFSLRETMEISIFAIKRDRA